MDKTMEYYAKAASKLFGDNDHAEIWLDEHSVFLKDCVNSVDEAEDELIIAINTYCNGFLI